MADEVTQLADGIYFGLAEETYHAQRRLSPSGIKQLRISAATFWVDSWLNPQPPVLTEDQQLARERAKVLGRAYHAARLEPDTFHERFVRKLDERDFAGVPGFRKGSDAYGAALGELGETKKRAGEGVEAQAMRLEEAIHQRTSRVDPGCETLPDGFVQGPIWHVELAEWERTKGDRTAIPALNWDEILQDMERIASVPDVYALLSEGFAEVSLLWTDEQGRKWKTRLDYLRADGWADFKTFANGSGKNVQQVIMESFRFNRYHIQAAVQRTAVRLVQSAMIGPRGDYTAQQAALIAQLQDTDGQELRCDFIWQEKGGVPNLFAKQLQFMVPDASAEAIRELEESGADEEHLRRARDFQRISDSKPRPSVWFGRAQMEVDAAVREFDLYSQVYEPGQPWLPFNPTGEITDADFPKFWLEGN